MKNVQAVSVMYHGRKVGTLSMGNRSNCQFEYDNDWLSDGFSISPLQLPLKAGLFTADYQPFNGNFGVFEDSLPGGYGEYLLRKVLKKSGVDPQGLTPVQWLSIVGNSGMGALCYLPETKLQQEDSQRSFDEMQQIALDVLSERTEENADMLYFKSGNSGGVRPKAIFSDADGHWLVKFRHTYDPKYIGQLEYDYNKVARQCGIDVPEFKLIEGKYFAVRRFDIENDVRLHVATASALLNEPITPPKMEYHNLLQLTGYLTQSPKAVEQQFRRMAFNVFAHNMDDHARNFSFICRDGKWSLAPAYDLTNDATLGEHASTINFKGLPSDEDMITVGMNIRMSRERCQQIIEEVREGTRELKKYF
ncbi:type II toxin-antitoxin system HipA family toxin [Prevotella communis]|uniref:type II toxin-antitoxin system HipA family toxin n=1 Tax=Prevotella communis TaxID=2913614 RepID=UPI001EDB5192|nr:type II toxin-antitoxin system HipA family toxin [Prevotella communis]UKK69145.1 type II toxin-antitoxin system HipA family toxin [Prevotella communis]UKK71907.1 type II toxin-antitoxin system HipA family toxin [Prevotella communis]